MESYFNKRMNKIKKASSYEYLEWLVNFTNIHNCWSDDTFTYNEDIKEEDKNNAEILSYFFSYIKELQVKQNIVFEISYDYYDFDEEIIYFEYNDNYYELSNMFGQGAVTTIKKIKEKPEDYVVVGKELTEEELENNKLVEVIIINEKYISNNLDIINELMNLNLMTFEKYKNTEKYSFWQKEKQREFFLINNEEIEIIKDIGVFVITKESDIMILSLGIIPRKNIIKNVSLKKLIKEDKKYGKTRWP